MFLMKLFRFAIEDIDVADEHERRHLLLLLSKCRLNCQQMTRLLQ